MSAINDPGGPAARLTRYARQATRFARFGLVGASGVLVNMGALWLLVERARLVEVAAAALATEAAILWNFALNDRWTFRAAPRRWPWPVRAARYNVVAGCGLLISLVTMALLTGPLRLHYLLANLCAIAAATGWNYAANAHFTWMLPAAHGLANVREPDMAWLAIGGHQSAGPRSPGPAAGEPLAGGDD